MDLIHNTAVEIVALLLDNKEKEFSIREIAKGVNIDYKAVYIKIKELEKAEIITVKRMGNTSFCSIKKERYSPIIYVSEALRRENILKNKDLSIILSRIKDRIKSPFFTLLLFGSYASRTNKKGSDIDLMLIADDISILHETERIIADIPLKIHLTAYTTNEFKSMIESKAFNVGKEAFKNNIVLLGIENYYGMISND